jgi:hypothetical protein
MWKAAQRPGGHSRDWCADTAITELYAPPAVPGRAWTRFEVLRETHVDVILAKLIVTQQIP